MKLTAKKTTVTLLLIQKIGPREKGSYYECNMMLASILIKQKKALLAEVPDIREAVKDFKSIYVD